MSLHENKSQFLNITFSYQNLEKLKDSFLALTRIATLCAPFVGRHFKELKSTR